MIKVHKTVFTDGSYVPSFTLQLQVIEVPENIPAAIFVHRFTPKSQVMSKDDCEFWNVAYYDELTSIPDYIRDRKKTCFVRKSSVDKSFANMDDLNEFLATVTHDIQRLIQQADSQKLENCEVITVTDSAISEVGVSCTDTSNSSDSGSESIDSVVLSFEG